MNSYRRSMIAWSVICGAMLCFLSDIALADCGTPNRATYLDVRSIFVERRGGEQPDFRFLVTQDGQAYFNARVGAPVRGEYSGWGASLLFRKLLATLENKSFYQLQLRPDPFPSKGWKTITIRTDGPEDHVALVRCGVETRLETSGDGGSVFSADPNDSRTRRFIDLVDALQSQIFAWPWAREQHLAPERPQPSATPRNR